MRAMSAARSPELRLGHDALRDEHALEHVEPSRAVLAFVLPHPMLRTSLRAPSG